MFEGVGELKIEFIDRTVYYFRNGDVLHVEMCATVHCVEQNWANLQPESLRLEISWIYSMKKVIQLFILQESDFVFRYLIMFNDR